MTRDLILLYAKLRDHTPDVVIPLPATGSHRRYFRMICSAVVPSESVIGVIGTDAAENSSFISMARHFASKGIKVPKILAVSEDGLTYIQEDLGQESLFDAVANGRADGKYSAVEEGLLLNAVSALPRIQFEGGDGLDFDKVCFQEKAFGKRQVIFDLNYFKYCFLKTSGVEFNEIPLQNEFERMAADLTEGTHGTFLYRDFQARNIMLHDGEPYFIDFQGGMAGPIYYDLASFVWQARARYGKDLRGRLVDAYLEKAGQYTDIDRGEFVSRLKFFALFRTLQVLGAYGFRGKFEHKGHFIESIPFAVDNLRELLSDPDLQECRGRYPYLVEILRTLCAMPEFSPVPVRSDSAEDSPVLEIDITSFSYKKGLPEDRSGNGGGYVFDCRGTHNPGRYEQYRHSTGLDADVIEFLEKNGEITMFLDSVNALVDHHVRRFIDRGFTHLSISFGCTGGQHRSVYSAEQTALHLASKFSGRVRVSLTHRELGITRIIQDENTQVK